MPASWAYGAAVRLRNAWLDRREPWRAPCPVISVGNLTAGGTGKSPMVRWICEALIASGIRPAVAMRGYRGATDSDEVREHLETMPGVPVWVGSDRRDAIERGWASGADVQAIVLDDAFQHRHVARDLDLVLIDATRPGVDGWLLPMGWLREPTSGLRRASATVLTRAGEADAMVEAAVARWHGRPPLARCSHAWLGLARIERGVACESALVSLRDLPVAVWAGVGHPQAVVAEVLRHGALVRDVPAMRDHQSFDAGRVAQWVASARSAGAQAVLCTAKDWTKLRHVQVPLPVLVPRLGLRFESGEAALRASILATIRGWKPGGADTLAS